MPRENLVLDIMMALYPQEPLSQDEKIIWRSIVDQRCRNEIIANPFLTPKTQQTAAAWKTSKRQPGVALPACGKN